MAGEWSHLLPADAAALESAAAQRDAMPRHYYAADDRRYEKGCQFRVRRGGVRCGCPPEHPVHLTPPK